MYEVEPETKDGRRHRLHQNLLSCNFLPLTLEPQAKQTPTLIRKKDNKGTAETVHRKEQCDSDDTEIWIQVLPDPENLDKPENRAGEENNQSGLLTDLEDNISKNPAAENNQEPHLDMQLHITE